MMTVCFRFVVKKGKVHTDRKSAVLCNRPLKNMPNCQICRFGMFFVLSGVDFKKCTTIKYINYEY